MVRPSLFVMGGRHKEWTKAVQGNWLAFLVMANNSQLFAPYLSQLLRYN